MPQGEPAYTGLFGCGGFRVWEQNGWLGGAWVYLLGMWLLLRAVCEGEVVVSVAGPCAVTSARRKATMGVLGRDERGTWHG